MPPNIRREKMFPANLVRGVLFLHSALMLQAQDPSLCGITWSCFKDPPSCTTFASCKALIMYRSVEKSGTLEFAIGGPSGGYIAFGLNTKGDMDGTIGEACLMDGTVKLRTFKAVGHDKPKLNDPIAQYKITSQGVVNGSMLCRYTRPIATPGGSEIRDGSQKWYLVLSHGTVSSGTLDYHGSSGRVASSSSVDLLQVSAVTSGSKTDKRVVAHACLMTVAWMFFAAVGIFTAGHMKGNWPDKRVFGEKVWFQIHRGCMLFVVLLTLIAFILIFVAAGEFSSGKAENHAVVGVVVTSLAVMQPVMAMLRPHPDQPRRWIFKLAHNIVGKSAFILASVNIFLGLDLFEVTLGVMVAYVVLVIVVAIFGAVVKFRQEKEGWMDNDDQPEGELSTMNVKRGESKWETVFGILFWICLLCTLAFCAAQLGLIIKKKSE